MKKTSLIFGILLLLISVLPSQVKASTLSCYEVDGLAIFGYDYGEWKFIGAIANEYNSDSIANEYGAGSEYNSDSIFNDYGSFGSEYSSYSAFNDYASNPPIIVNNNYKFIGYVTTNDYKTPSINTYEAIACAKKSYSSPSSKMEDITFKSIPSSYSGGYSSTPSSNQYTCPKNSHSSPTDETKCDCNTGYQINSAKNACVLAPIKTNDQICQDDFGGNVIWDGSKTNDGNLNCNCKSGYAWNTGRTACEIYINPFPAGCASNIGFSLTTGMSCDGTNRCSDGMQLNSNKTSCVSKPIVASPKKIEPKPLISTISTKSEVKLPEIVTAEKKSEVIPHVSIEPVKKLKWYKKIFNWFK